MNFWMSGEIQGDLADDHRVARLWLRSRINEYFAGRNYGASVEEWRVLPIILASPEYFPEVSGFNAKERAMEFRLQISYEKFRIASVEEQRKLLFESIMRSVEVGSQISIFPADFDLDSLRRDLVKFGHENSLF